MIILLWGADASRARKKCQAILARYRQLHPAGFRIHEWDEESFSFDAFLQALGTFSMFREKKLLLLKNLISDEELRKYVSTRIKLLASDQEAILVFLEEMLMDL